MFFKNQRIGKYEILETIGSGGFGSVYLAKDIWIDKKVAIKVPHKQGDNFEKLLREPRLLAALNHPHIVSVITAEKTNDVFFIVMEYVDGISLERYLRKHRMLPIDLALAWFIDIGEAVAYAHTKNILHRDIRPANVLISVEGVVKLADLGTSRYLVDNPFASTRIGSPPYMAPEHFKGKATFQSDVYSFGVLMYECVTGILPFFDKNPRKLAQIVSETNAMPPHHHNPQVPIELSRLICKAMHRIPSSRTASAEEAVRDLKNAQRLGSPGAGDDTAGADVREVKAMFAKPWFPKEIPTREISSLFCWNCSRPIQKRNRTCPHCSVAIK